MREVSNDPDDHLRCTARHGRRPRHDLGRRANAHPGVRPPVLHLVGDHVRRHGHRDRHTRDRRGRTAGDARARGGFPRGRLAGPTFGVVLLVAVSPFIDPLRPDNFDFDRLGPGWLSVLLFAALAVLQGALLAAVAGRLSRSLPLMSRENLPATGPPLLPAVVLLPIGVVLAAGALVAGAFPRFLPWFLTVRASRGGVIAGRLLLAVVVLVALPAFIAAVVSIWGR